MADDRGRVWGGPTFGQTLFYIDAKTGKATNTRTVSDNGGEVYDAAVVDGVCYAASYAGGVDLECDLLAKYVWKCLRGGGVTHESLKQAGFLRDHD